MAVATGAAILGAAAIGAATTVATSVMSKPKSAKKEDYSAQAKKYSDVADSALQRTLKRSTQIEEGKGADVIGMEQPANPNDPRTFNGDEFTQQWYDRMSSASSDIRNLQ